MPLADVTSIRSYLRIETTAEDALLAVLLAEAIGSIEAATGKSLTTEDVVWYDQATSLRLYAPVTNLLLGYTPVDPDTVVVTDVEGTATPSAGYTVRQDQGMIMGGGDTVFDTGPYTIAATAGFGTSPNYETKWLPMINAIIIDYVAMLYQQRTPGATREAASGTSVDYEIDAECGLPHRIARGVRKLRGIVA